MLLSQYVAELQQILADHGNMPCYYATDDEGNSYQQVNYCGNVYFVPELEHRLESVYSSRTEYDEEIEREGYCEKCKRKSLIAICVIN